MDCTTCPTRATCGQVCPELEAQLKKRDTPRREVLFNDIGGNIENVSNAERDFWASGQYVARYFVADLSQRERECLTRYFVDGDRKSKIAEDLGVQRQVVESYINRGIAKLDGSCIT